MRNGFSLLEILIAMSITMVIGTVVFQLFQQNERVFRDQNLMSEMQQSARATITQVSDEIRMAGQGVPVYATTFDAGPSEAAVSILAGSNSTRIQFRAGLAPTETSVISPSPAVFTIGTPATLIVDNVTGLYNAVGGGPSGRFIYICGDAGDSSWRWVRASITSVTPSTRNVRVIPTETGTGGNVQFPVAPTIALEEGIAIFFDSSTGTIKRTTASNLTDPMKPNWAPANDLATNVTSFNLDYFDKLGNPIISDTLVNRALIARVQTRLTVQTTQELSNRSRPIFAMSVRSNIRNSAIR